MDQSTIDSRIRHLSTRLFDTEVAREKFEASLLEMKAGNSICLDLSKDQSLPSDDRLPETWRKVWNFTVSPHSDSSYSMDCSSVFMASPLIEILKNLGKENAIICDCCAAPGGKSLLGSLALKPKLIIANEKSNARVKSLISNFSNFEIKNAIITCLDLNSLVHNFPLSFNTVILDAPCSGQSLIARGVGNYNSLTRVTIDRSSHIQKNLINKAAKLVNSSGYLMYSTCTFSREENEKVIEWFIRKNPNFSAVTVPHLLEYQSEYSDLPCYRLWPYQDLGSGGFTCLLKNSGISNTDNAIDFDSARKKALWQSLTCSP